MCAEAGAAFGTYSRFPHLSTVILQPRAAGWRGCEIGVSPLSKEEFLRIRAGRKPLVFIWLSWEGSGI